MPSMSGKEKPRRRPSSKHTKTHRRRPGLISSLVTAVKKLGYGTARVAGPLLVGAGAATVAVPVASQIKQGLSSAYYGDSTQSAANFAYSGTVVKETIVPAALLVTAGYVTSKVVSHLR